MERRRQAAEARDGRALAFAEWGDPDGFPVFSLHGTPTSRLWRHPDESRYAEAGARVITYDRPGYGGSDRHRGRRVVDCAADVEAIADRLGLDRFAVTGRSGGGPHSLAVAARLPERVVRAESVVGIAPFDAAGLDWFHGMDALNVRETSWAVAGEEVAARELEREAAELLARIESDASAVLGDDWQLAPVDRAALARPELADVIREAFGEAFRNGVWGWVDDDLAFVSGWGSTWRRSACRPGSSTARPTRSCRRVTASGSRATSRARSWSSRASSATSPTPPPSSSSSAGSRGPPRVPARARSRVA
jgi:pimeloyl-ACP methyl ester carboxylesterase